MVFWLIFIGFNLAFLPMHLTGLLGMPRRAYTYSAELGPVVQWLNLLSTAAAMVLAIGIVAFCIDVMLALRHGRRAPHNPWQAGTLEWALPTPPPVYNFISIPAVIHRDPLWQDPTLPATIRDGRGFLAGAPRGVREILGTSLRAAVPEQVIRVSGSTWIPLVAALTLTLVLALFIAKLFLLAVIAFMGTIAVLLRWTWTTGDPGVPAEVDAGGEGAQRLVLPTQSASRQSPGWWGTAMLLLVDGSLFASLVFAYFYLWLGAPEWPPAGQAVPALGPPALAMLLLLGSGIAIHLAVRANAGVRPDGARRHMLLAAVAMSAFIGMQWWVLSGSSSPASHAYASVVHVLVGYHLVHAGICVLMAGYLWLRSRRGWLDAARGRDARVVALFWNYTIAVWLVGAVLVHLFPRWA